jgi:hypothetical protein
MSDITDLASLTEQERADRQAELLDKLSSTPIRPDTYGLHEQWREELLALDEIEIDGEMLFDAWVPFDEGVLG